ncbi:MAG: alpha-L-rhamnosidase N-terminal domain-containing protein, partial [Clostridia bacterium]|nr:alpha-L-rhamnosidase N-terminal domain-containing protein [Clostridia bacterium]
MNYETKIKNMTTEYLSEPIGIDAEKVHFGWNMTSNVIGEKQTAYQIKVFSEDGNMVWDSGKTESDKSVGILCPTELQEATVYNWDVTVWNEVGDTFKNTSTFETGVTSSEEWKSAEFIRMNLSRSAPVFRTEKKLQSGNIRKARLYITALGAYQAYVNGNQVGEWKNGEIVYNHMNPGYGNGNVSLGYQTYDVTNFLSDYDSIAVAVQAGTGWYNGMGTVGATQPAIKALVVITYEDGTEQIIKTNITDW